MCKNYVSYYLKKLPKFDPVLYRVSIQMFLKLLKLHPIIKKGSLHNISNYRPVSVLSNLSNNFENLIYYCLQSFFLSNILIFLINYYLRFKKKKHGICVFFSISLLALTHFLAQYFIINLKVVVCAA